MTHFPCLLLYCAIIFTSGIIQASSITSFTNLRASRKLANPNKSNSDVKYTSSSCSLRTVRQSSLLRLAMSPASTTPSLHVCKLCGASFKSRNLLFRHINQCSQWPQDELRSELKEGSSVDGERHSLSIRFSYVCNNTAKLSVPEAQLANKEIQNALRIAMKARSATANGMYSNDDDDSIEILSSTQASVANQRHRSLSQEIGCAASNDILTVSFCNPPAWFAKEKHSGFNCDGQNFLALLSDKLNSILLLNATTINVRILDISYLISSTFHAENSCTQYTYNYLLPLQWLRDGSELERWWLLSENKNINATSAEFKLKHPGAFQSQPPSNSLKKMSNALKSAESISVPNRRVRRRLIKDGMEGIHFAGRKIEKVATRKLGSGTLSKKERRAWHNFADPNLRGEASPNQEPVWRVIDRARIAEIRKNPINQKVVAVIEFVGDGFLPMQIRRIVGSVVGITNGFLPENFFEIATRPDIAMMTVLAPPDRLYLRDLRFLEQFDNNDETQLEDARQLSRTSMLSIQNQMFSILSKKETIESEDMWVHDLQETIAPKVCKQISGLTDCNEVKLESGNLDPAPEVYSKTLVILKKISLSGWPDTSLARSKVIQIMADKNRDLGSEIGGNTFGSFTIVNPRLFQSRSSQNLPLGNTLFPELVNSVFELEEHLCKQQVDNFHSRDGAIDGKRRQPSTHCAVNFNASFTPHVDSGTGLGQSLSMIVGLGDFNGGEIFVEGEAFPIRYKPLEFNGWTQRHWTAPYNGERFSLVWFTPKQTNK